MTYVAIDMGFQTPRHLNFICKSCKDSKLLVDDLKLTWEHNVSSVMDILLYLICKVWGCWF